MVKRTSRPRTTDAKCLPDSQVVTGYCSMPTMPSICRDDTLLPEMSYSRSISFNAGKPLPVSDS